MIDPIDSQFEARFELEDYCKSLESKLEKAEALMLLVSQCANGSPAMDNAIEACRQEYRKSQQQGGGCE